MKPRIRNSLLKLVSDQPKQAFGINIWIHYTTTPSTATDELTLKAAIATDELTLKSYSDSLALTL
jgi:hypothetical protein